MELLDDSISGNAPHRKTNLKKEIVKYLRSWYWILLSLLLFYIASRIYLRYAEPLFLSKTTLKFAESKSKGSNTLSDLQTLGTGLSGDSELQSETTAIVSKPILSKVVTQLNLGVSFFAQGAIKETELYPNSPIEGKIVSIDDANFSVATYTLTPINNSEYELSNGALISGKRTFRFGSVASLPFGRVLLQKRNNEGKIPTLKVVFRSTANIVSYLESAINVSLPENKGLLMDLTLVSPNPKKSEDILNEITKQYNIENVNDRNEEALNTQNFINDRLSIISGDLSGIETQKEDFKKRYQITDLEAQAGQALANNNDNTKQLVNLTTQLDLVNSISNASNGEKLIPSNMGLSPVTETYLSKYNELLLQKNKTLKQATTLNPSVIELNRELGEIKNLIKKNLQETRETLQLQIAQVKARLNLDKATINNYPSQEKVFRGIERQQNLKEQLYIYLLQKREENAITLAVTTPKAKVLNPAYTTGIVKPNKKQITTGALAAGLLLPIGILFLIYFLDTKIHSKEDIVTRFPNATVLAEVPLSDKENSLVKENDFSVYAESFRILSSNMKFILKTVNNSGQKSGVVLVTSSVKGEGKTTVAMNVATTLSGSAKVLIIGADIRNPQLQRYMPETQKGLTDYLISEDTSAENYIVPFEGNKNLDIFFSGSIAPNPNDLLEMEKFDKMLEDQKKKYQYIVLDSAPVMLVSDTLHLIENADVTLYVLKSDSTENEMLDFAEEFKKNNGIKNMVYILNNVRPRNTRYGKKYGYGYYAYSRENQKESNWFRRIFYKG